MISLYNEHSCEMIRNIKDSSSSVKNTSLPRTVSCFTKILICKHEMAHFLQLLLQARICLN